ncbi:tdc operon transcriptional activator [Escherichia coli]|nr:tdc operon transcriptional activator [Escherichia coli]
MLRQVFPKSECMCVCGKKCVFLTAYRDERLVLASGTLIAEMRLQDLHVGPLF